MNEASFRIKIGDNEVEIKGTEESVKALIDEYFSEVLKNFPSLVPITIAKPSEKVKPKEAEAGKRKKTGETKELLQRLPQLKNEGFFDVPRSLREVRDKLREKGWYHSNQIIQAVILSHPELGIKRIKADSGYKYVKS